jgi:tRNA/tmRNA/rRNA uracil-C5-methylase (TrmA/RlmC/RlmD family)
LTVLMDSGFRLDRIALVDMFPQTFHIETVVSLVR